MLELKLRSMFVANRLPGCEFWFFFFSREESRVHIRVSHSDGRAKFWLRPTIEFARHIGLSS
jgi:hypothetical protein